MAEGPGPSGSVSGRTALVTGGGNGLGRTIALALGDAGARVIVAGRTESTLEQTAVLLRRAGHDVRTRLSTSPTPRRSPRCWDDLSDEVVSILINNAGVPGPVAALVDVEPDEWDEVFAVNVRGSYLICRAFLPAMIERAAGDVINLASVSGKRPLARRTPYCASKMAVIGLTTTLAAEVGPLGITVNCLSPGPVRGPRMDRNMLLESQRLGITVEEATERFVSRAALGRMLEEDEVGRAVVAMLNMPGLHAADVDLSAGMVAR